MIWAGRVQARVWAARQGSWEFSIEERFRIDSEGRNDQQVTKWSDDLLSRPEQPSNPTAVHAFFDAAHQGVEKGIRALLFHTLIHRTEPDLMLFCHTPMLP